MLGLCTKEHYANAHSCTTRVGSCARGRPTQPSPKCVKRIDASGMAIAPDDLQSVRPDQLHGPWYHVEWYGFRSQQRPATHLLHALGARTGEPKGTRRMKDRGRRLLPLDGEPSVAASDAVRRESLHDFPLGYLDQVTETMTSTRC